jgi:hypothetical protein
MAASDIGRATYSPRKIPRSEAPERCQTNGCRWRKAGRSFGLNFIKPGLEGCTARSKPLGVVVGQRHRGDDAHVVGDEVGALEVGRRRGRAGRGAGLAFDTRIVGHGPAGPAQAGADDAVAACGDDRSYGVPLSPVLRESVQQHDRLTFADSGDVSAKARRLDHEMLEAGCLWQRGRPGRGVDGSPLGRMSPNNLSLRTRRRASKASKDRLRFCGSIGVPTRVVNTSPSSCRAPPSARRSSMG